MDNFIFNTSSNWIEFNHKHIKKIEYRISQHVIRFDKYQHTHFWNRVEDAFIGQPKDKQ